MKKVITLMFMFSVFLLYSQEEHTAQKEQEFIKVKTTSISYTVDSIKELEEINWENVRGFFSKNNQDERIEISFELDLKKSRNKFKSSIKVSGETKNLDSLIIKSKKGVKALINISKKYKE